MLGISIFCITLGKIIRVLRSKNTNAKKPINLTIITFISDIVTEYNKNILPVAY